MRYSIGVYGGLFDPLHMGHLSCIIQAANMCEKLYIVLSVSSKRGEIEYRIRYRWLYQLTKHIGNVKIITLANDLDAGQEYTKEQRESYCKYVREQIGEPVSIVFCSSDSSLFKVCYPESEFYVFEESALSSADIRNNPYKHWDQLPNVVKPYYNKKVLLVGGESTGKSTLAINLANYFNTNYIDEAGRELSLKSGEPELMLSEDFTEILLQHKLNEMKALEQSNKVLFVDTDALVTQFYLIFFEDGEKEKNTVLSDAIDALNTYDLILFLEPDVAFVHDGDRSAVIEADRKKYSDQIKEILDRHGRKYICISGDYQDRFKTAVKEVEGLLGV